MGKNSEIGRKKELKVLRCESLIFSDCACVGRSVQCRTGVRYDRTRWLSIILAAVLAWLVCFHVASDIPPLSSAPLFTSFSLLFFPSFLCYPFLSHLIRKRADVALTHDVDNEADNYNSNSNDNNNSNNSKMIIMKNKNKNKKAEHVS